MECLPDCSGSSCISEAVFCPMTLYISKLTFSADANPQLMVILPVDGFGYIVTLPATLPVTGIADVALLQPAWGVNTPPKELKEALKYW